MKCFSCGADKDLSEEKVYPYPEDGSLCDEPISQLLTIECQGKEDKPDGRWRLAVMCHDCWHRLQTSVGIDLWIGEKCWELLDPVTPFAGLPKVFQGSGSEKWKAENYDLGRVPII